MKKAIYAIAISLILTLSTILIFKHINAPNEYNVYIDILPNKISPRRISVNTDFMIASHLYYPLLRVGGLGQISSDFLDMARTMAYDSTFSGYQLCLKEKLFFSNGSQILSRHVVEALREVMIPERGFLDHKIEIEGDCIKVLFTSPDKSFFHKISSIATTPLYDKKSMFPVGLGPYKLEKVDDNKISLAAVDDKKVGTFKRLNFINSATAGDVPEASVPDTNYTRNKKPLENLNRQMKEIIRPAFKSYALVVNYPDEKIRRLLLRCINSQEFLERIGLRLKSIPGFLPEGIPGWNIADKAVSKSIGKSECVKRDTDSITYLHYDDSTSSEAANFFEKHSTTLPIPIVFSKVSPKELVIQMYSAERVMSVVGFDSVNDPMGSEIDGMSFFEPFIAENRSERLVSNTEKRLVELGKQIQSVTEPKTRSNLLRILHTSLIDSAMVIPLGEQTRSLSYPVEIKNIVWIGKDGLSSFPDISSMTWSIW